MTASLRVQAIESMPFGENSYIVWREGEESALVIDPGLEPELLLDYLAQQGLGVAAILNTHGHGDHIAGNEAIKEAFPDAPLIIGVNDAPLLQDADANMSAPFGWRILSPPADRLVHEGDTIEAAGIPLDVLDIPGHSPGHVVFVHRDRPFQVFGGDVLFRGGIGRFDFPAGDGRLLVDGIRRKLFTLPDDTVVHPGHGPSTTIGYEKRTNPFVGMGATLEDLG